MQRHRWQQLLVFLSQLGSQLLRVSQMVIILQQMVQVHQVFFKQCLDGALTAIVEDQIQSALNAYNAQGLSAWNY